MKTRFTREGGVVTATPISAAALRGAGFEDSVSSWLTNPRQKLLEGTVMFDQPSDAARYVEC